MPTAKNNEKLPLLNDESQGSRFESIINFEALENDNESTNELQETNKSQSWNNLLEIDNNWKNAYSRYGGITQKRKDVNNNWEYKTKIKLDKIIITVINESFENINNKLFWKKYIVNTAGQIILELSKLDDNKQLTQIFKIYDNEQKYDEDLLSLDFNSFQQKQRDLLPEYNFLEGIIIKTIDNIDEFIENIKSLNKELESFKENKTNNDLNILLKLYKYLTVMQNFIYNYKSSIDKSISAKFKKMLTSTSNLIWGIVQIYIGLTGKNLQRVVSNYPIDGKEHTSQNYIDAIFLNWQNYLMVLIDTILGTFLTSAASIWSRDVIFNKKNNVNPFDIRQFNYDGFEKYKDVFEALLYEENHQELMKRFSQIVGINDLMQKFNELENYTEFEYHPTFIKEIESIQKLLDSRMNNNDGSVIEIKKIIDSANSIIKKDLKPISKPIALVNNWGRNLVMNLSFEFLIWAGSHVILTGSSENTYKENFNLQDWITKDIFNTGALAANISRYFVIRPINNIFKSSLETLGIPTNICPEKFSKWVNKQSKSKKLLMAIPLFLSVTFVTSAIKTEAALTTEYGIKKAKELFYEKFFRLKTLVFAIGVTIIDMIVFAISDFYKEVFNQSISITTLIKILTKCCGFNEQETSLLEDNFRKLEKSGKLPSFDDEFKKLKGIISIDSGIEEFCKEIIEPSTSTRIYNSNLN